MYNQRLLVGFLAGLPRGVFCPVDQPMHLINLPKKRRNLMENLLTKLNIDVIIYHDISRYNRIY